MFTGLIEAVGQVAEVKPLATGFRLRILTPLAREVRPGESLAVNGVCLTLVFAGADELHAELAPETARVTTLASLKRGALVNLERPLRADGRVGGHLVQGHVDGIGTVEEIRREEQFAWLTIAYPAELAPYIVRKGSIAVDGISLTVAGLDARRFDVQIVPYTWEHTNVRALRVHDRVNLECDILGKYVVRALEAVAAEWPLRAGSSKGA
jgi:riboflavin synthase